jgi:AbrB family looped-hinge helix DNA binding protein
MSETKVKISGGGRVVIPVEYRKALDLEEGDELILRLDQGELRLLTSKQAIKDARAIVRRYVPKNRPLADELIAERRKEYENEE